MIARLLPALLLALLSACGGGGGGGGGGDRAPTNSSPIADAGADDAARSGSVVELDGSGSRDPDGVITSYRWRQVEGPAVQLEGADAEIALFLAPAVNDSTQLVFSLQVTDDAGASASDSVAVRIEPAVVAQRFSLSGTISASASQTLDSDVNNPEQPAVGNNSLETAQSVPNPTTLGGYVSLPGEGAGGSLTATGDSDDFFQVDLLEGQVVTMLVADFVDADADLYLLDDSGDTVDLSIATGEIEQVTAPEDGSYFINASAFLGATNYILAIGSQAGPAARADIVPWQAVVEFNQAADTPTATPQLQPEERMALRRRAGRGGRPALMRLERGNLEARVLRARLGAAFGKRQRIGDPALRARWETLMTVKSLQRDPQVAVAEPNYRVRALATPDDEAFPFQWHLPMINLPAAWDFSTGDPTVTVAVVDSGILGNHPDLRGQLVPGFDFVRDPDSALDGNGIDPDPSDPGSLEPGGSFHGTHVAGTVAAAGDNGIGVAGVAYGARVMPLRALGAGGAGTSYDVRQAIRYAAGLPNDSGTLPERPANIINLSLGGAGFSSVDQALFRQLHDAGVVVVAAAGNEGSRAPSYPAAYDRVISVSAVDGLRGVTRYSNVGPTVDLAAPGGDNSADINGDGYPDGVLSTGATVSGGRLSFAYTFLNGTSMAAPHVAGVMALMKSVNPDLTPADIDAMLVRGELSDDLGPPGRDDGYGHGMINAERAVTAALTAAGGRPGDNPRLAASAGSLNFSLSTRQLSLTLSNAGRGELQVVAVTSDQPWLTVTPADVDAAGLGAYLLQVDRSGLPAGVARATVTARSSVNTVNVPVLISVSSGPDNADLGVVYVLLVDTLVDAVVAEFIARAEGGDYRFRFDSVPEADYRVIAGTDNDNDLFICDAGDACGAWLTTDQPIDVRLDRDLSDIDFPLEFQVSIPTLQDLSADTGSGPAAGLARPVRAPGQ